ncbi:hypothetical protein NEOLI_004571 [Neolecta irregularis DAH-3]|uniref:BTB domain-containing protein n=1 Tax=Neolecta irregularis (strain DAH-3) TaxID=1198029 RepID=A0A1U7LLD6_NEOID|nr:hypothetical protein NEOLI_004571 [Neolecta irregularis DAH-3]|eukprot:OLL23467.1 hypothetical protein NEOLI_004571 [Neolecta irregularis DAH-3]
MSVPVIVAKAARKLEYDMLLPDIDRLFGDATSGEEQAAVPSTPPKVRGQIMLGLDSGWTAVLKAHAESARFKIPHLSFFLYARPRDHEEVFGNHWTRTASYDISVTWCSRDGTKSVAAMSLKTQTRSYSKKNDSWGWENFTEVETPYRKELSAHLKLTIYESPAPIEISSRHLNYKQELLQLYGKLLQSPDSSNEDLVIAASQLGSSESTDIFVSKNILCERSDFFKNMINGQFSETMSGKQRKVNSVLVAVIEMETIDVTALKAILHWLHTDTIKFSDFEILHAAPEEATTPGLEKLANPLLVYRLCDMYQIDRLKSLALAYTRAALNKDNVIDVLQKDDAQAVSDYPELYQVFINLFKLHHSQIRVTDKFLFAVTGSSSEALQGFWRQVLKSLLELTPQG